MTELLRELEAVVCRMEAIKVANWDVDTAELSATRIAVIDFVHDHHAEIAEALEEAAYGRALKEAMEVEYKQAKESSLRRHGRQQQWLTIYSTLRRLKVAANHLCDDTHNSAREVGG